MARTIVNKPGVYLIRNLMNGSIYVGSTMDTRRRFAHHRWMLRIGKHRSSRLQADWSAFGEAAFEFQIVLVTEDEAARKAEEGRLILQAMESGVAYNTAKDPYSNAGTVRSQESRNRTSAALKGMVFTEDHRKKIGDGNRGKFVSEETRLKQSLAAKGRKRSPEAIAKGAAKRRGQTHSPETKALLSQKAKDRSAAKRINQGIA